MLAAVAGLTGCAAVRPCGNLDVGPIVLRDTSTLGHTRMRVAGPVYEHQEAGKRLAFTGVRPFYSVTTDRSRDRTLREFLWPLGIVKDLGRERHWRFLTAYGHDFDRGDPESRYRGMVFPLLFWGEDAHGESYAAAFPFGGKLNEFIGRDRIVFVLFPLYAYSTINDLETWDVLWPIYSRTTGGDVDRLRIFPFYGQSSNGDDWHKHFVLWPIWTHARYHYPQSSGTAFILFPLFGRTRLTDQQGWMVLPPLIRWSRRGDHTELNCPWPFLQYASGDFEKLYIWPLWGRRRTEKVVSSFYLWPIGRTLHAEREDHVLDRHVLLPFVYHERKRAMPDATSDAEPEVTARYFKLWPLCSYQREDDVLRTRLPDLWPLKDTGPVERNLAPLWTLFTRTRAGDNVEHELLWGMYRYRRDGEHERRVSVFPLLSSYRCGSGDDAVRSWSFLLGLLGREQAAGESTWRFLWFLEY